MDGLELGRTIKTSLFPAVKIVLMVPSSQDVVHQKKHYRDFVTDLKKPIRYFDPLKTVNLVISGSSFDMAEYPAQLRPNTKTDHKRNDKILLVEDNIINQQVVRGVIQQLGFQNIDIVDNGVEAIKALRVTHYSVVLMDIQMPKLDGLETTRLIRTGTAGVLDDKIPIIALTAHVMKGDREQYLAVGMNDYIPKPIDPIRLETTLDRLLPPALSKGLSLSSPVGGVGFALQPVRGRSSTARL